MNDWNKAVADLQDACRDTFGIPVRYIPSMETRFELGSKAIDLTGIFDDARETVSLMGGGGNGMEAVIPRPVVEIRLADLGIDPMDGDEVVVNEITYRILEIQPDGHGTASLILHRNQDEFGAF